MIKGTASPEGTDRKQAPRPYDVYRLVDLGNGSEPICQVAPSNLGLPQVGGFFPISASVFQIQSVFVPAHKPLLVRWTLRSSHSAYLRGKIRHLLCPPVCRKRVLGVSFSGGIRSHSFAASEVYATKCRNTTRKMTGASHSLIAPILGLCILTRRSRRCSILSTIKTLFSTAWVLHIHHANA